MGGASYNGYDWNQRDRILIAFQPLTGRRQPFEAMPCAMCCDPDRSSGQWHSEDYSEPFSFQPPETYPLCSACHGRIHTALQCAARGLGAVLPASGVRRLWLGVRSTVHDSKATRNWHAGVAQREPITLTAVRPRSPAPCWWRSLTLDPESLEAPWAPPRPLRPRPEAARFAEPLATVKISDQEASMLRTHAAAPHRTLTMRNLAIQSMDRNDPQTANLLYGKLARRLATWAGLGARPAPGQVAQLDDHGGGRLAAAGTGV